MQYTSDMIETLADAGLLDSIQCSLPKQPKAPRVRKMRDSRAN